MSDVDALVFFGSTPKAKAKAATDKQAGQKRDAAKRNRLMSNAPPHVKDRWTAICSAKGRCTNKNKQKKAFMDALFSDRDYKSAYWSLDVSHTVEWSSKNVGRWILRAKAEQDHGGGVRGAEAIESAIAIGLYQVRSVAGKDSQGRPIEVQQVKVVEDEDALSTSNSIKENKQLGASLEVQDVQNDALSLSSLACANDEAAETLAIMDAKVGGEAGTTQDEPGSSTSVPAQVAASKAGAKRVLKRPSAAMAADMEAEDKDSF
jgi:hypothetical protein